MGSPISLLYSAKSDGAQYNSRMSKPRGCNRRGKLVQGQPRLRIHLRIVDGHRELQVVMIDPVKPFFYL